MPARTITAKEDDLRTYVNCGGVRPDSRRGNLGPAISVPFPSITQATTTYATPQNNHTLRGPRLHGRPKTRRRAGGWRQSQPVVAIPGPSVIENAASQADSAKQKELAASWV